MRENNTGVVCPFCGEDDFDLTGLKRHMIRYCTAYQEADTKCENEDCPYFEKPRASGCGCIVRSIL